MVRRSTDPVALQRAFVSDRIINRSGQGLAVGRPRDYLKPEFSCLHEQFGNFEIMFEAFLLSVTAGLSVEVAKAAFAYVKKERPDLASLAANAESSNDFEKIDAVFKEAVGVIDAAAASGEIVVDKATLTALKGIRFDHQNGAVSISGTTISAPVLSTGGGAGASGKTVVGGKTKLKSRGTEIDVGSGASIELSGNAKIEQT